MRRVVSREWNADGWPAPEQPANDSENEDLPQRGPGRLRRILPSVVALALALSAGVLIGRSGRDRSHSTVVPTIRPPHTAERSGSVGPDAALAVPPHAPVELSPTGVFTTTASAGSSTLTVEFGLGSDNRRPVRVAYPIRLIAPSGVRLPQVTGGLYNVDTVNGHLDDVTLPRDRLRLLGANSLVDLVLRVRVVCDSAEVAAASRDRQPWVEVPLAGYRLPAVVPLRTAGGGFSDFVTQVCGTG